MNSDAPNEEQRNYSLQNSFVLSNFNLKLTQTQT